MEGERESAPFAADSNKGSYQEQVGKESEDAGRTMKSTSIETPTEEGQGEVLSTVNQGTAEEVSTPSDGINGETSTTAGSSWREKIMNHPYVIQGSGTLRQAAGTFQDKLQPLVNHPYIQKSTEAVSSTVQPWVDRGAKTVQSGHETVRKAINREAGYEPKRFVPFGAGVIGILLLCILIAGWGSGERGSKYGVDISKIVADRIQLPDGRYVAYCEWGATNDTAQHSVLVLHDFLSSRLAGIPGVSEKLLVTYGVRLVSYDRPGFGQSDPHPHRSFNSSAEDMVRIADALNLGQKFWVLAFSGGGPHAWAALKYIPERLAGVVMIAPAGNPYAKNMTIEETKELWGTLPRTQKNMFRLARYFPSLLPNFLKKTVKKINVIMRSMKKIVSEKDRALLAQDTFGAAWETHMRESVRQGSSKPLAEELNLLVHDWGFKLTDMHPKPVRQSFFQRVLFLFRRPVLPVFTGPIHIFQGTDDKLQPAAANDYAKRLLPEVQYHKLDGEGHYSWFCYCDACHRELFKTLFGEVEGLDELENPLEVVKSAATETLTPSESEGNSNTATEAVKSITTEQETTPAEAEVSAGEL